MATDPLVNLALNDKGLLSSSMELPKAEDVASDIIDAIPAMKSRRASTKKMYAESIKGHLKPWAKDIIESMAEEMEAVGGQCPPGSERAKIYEGARAMRARANEI